MLQYYIKLDLSHFCFILYYYVFSKDAALLYTKRKILFYLVRWQRTFVIWNHPDKIAVHLNMLNKDTRRQC